MKYNKLTNAKFLNRINRFAGIVDINGKEETVHIKNTGRCKELLILGTEVYLEQSDNPKRKTKYDLVAVDKNNSNKIVNIDSQAPNKLVSEWLGSSGIFSSDALIKQERVYGNSRFDFYIENGARKAFMEVKGVTLEKNGIALFPDAPTERGIKHLNELIDAVQKGFEAYVVFVIQFKGAKLFSPNVKTHKEFADTLRKASKKGVKVFAVDCIVEADGIIINDYVKTELNYESSQT